MLQIWIIMKLSKKIDIFILASELYFDFAIVLEVEKKREASR